MLIESGARRRLGTEKDSWLRFGEEAKQAGAWAGRRLLWMRDKPAFELSFWCGTCSFIFRRLDGANEGSSVDDLSPRMTQGLADLEPELIERFGDMLPAGDYLPLLIEVAPRLVQPVQEGDYFANEQVETWGVDSFWGLPEYSHTPYYRTFETTVDRDAHLYEFVVPMVPPSWNDRPRVNTFAQLLRTSSTPTAVAVSILDVCQPAVARPDGDYYAHWALTHFLLDGHHKMEAAAQEGRPLRLLSLLSIEGSLATTELVLRVPELRSRAGANRA
jgi:hypothetical protein